MEINFLKRWRESKLKQKQYDGKLVLPENCVIMTEEEMRMANGGVPICEAFEELTEEEMRYVSNTPSYMKGDCSWLMPAIKINTYNLLPNEKQGIFEQNPIFELINKR